MLKIQNITKKFGGVTALNNCTFTVEPGKITALIGPNGAGKTTLFDVISGIISADTGEILLTQDQEHIDLASLPPYRIAQLGLSRTWQQIRLFKYLSLADHLHIARQNDDVSLVKSFFSFQRTPHKQYEQILKKYGIDREPHVLVSELSYGQRKLLQIAMALEQSHVMLLLDEPVAGVNQRVQEQIETMLINLKKSGETILLIEHDMEFVKKIADTIIVMDEGRVIAQGNPQETLQEKHVIEAYLGA